MLHIVVMRKQAMKTKLTTSNMVIFTMTRYTAHRNQSQLMQKTDMKKLKFIKKKSSDDKLMEVRVHRCTQTRLGLTEKHRSGK